MPFCLDTLCPECSDAVTVVPQMTKPLLACERCLQIDTFYRAGDDRGIVVMSHARRNAVACPHGVGAGFRHRPALALAHGDRALLGQDLFLPRHAPLDHGSALPDRDLLGLPPLPLQFPFPVPPFDPLSLFLCLPAPRPPTRPPTFAALIPPFPSAPSLPSSPRRRPSASGPPPPGTCSTVDTTRPPITTRSSIPRLPLSRIRAESSSSAAATVSP